MFKKSLKIILCYLLILPSNVLAQSAAGLSFDDFNQVRLNAQSSSGLYLGQGVVNEYRLLGFNNYPTLQLDELNRTLRMRFDVLNTNFSITQTDFENGLRRASLFRQYMGVFSALQVNGHTTFPHLEARYGHYRSIVMSEFPASNFTNADLRSERVQLEINKRILAEFTAEQRQAALNRINEAKRSLANPRARATFNIRSGLSVSGALPRATMNYSPSAIYNHARGRVTIPVEDQFGRRTSVTVPQDPRVIENERASDMVRQSMRGQLVNMGLMGTAIVSFLFLSSMIQTHRNFESNPRQFERTLEQTLGVAMPLSIGSFFIGGAASQAVLGGDLNAYRRSLAHMDHLIKQERLGHISPQMRSRITRSYMSTMNPRSLIARATSHRGLAGGLLISKLVFLAADKLQSCLRLADYYGLADNNYPAYRVQQLEQSCNRAWSEVWSQVMASPQTYMELIALLSTKTLMTLTMTGAQALTYGVFRNQAERTAAEQASRAATMNRMSVVARGVIKSPVVRVIGGFTAFALVFHTVLWGLEEAYEYLTVNMPAVNVRKGLAEMFDDLRDSGWDMESLCRDYDFTGSFLGRTWNSIWDWSKEQTCGTQLADEYINHHNEVQNEWRSHLMSPFEQAVAQWQEYSHKILNGYNATYMFYKDIAEQVRVKRQQENSPDFSLSPEEQWVYYNDPLPLFRSDPYFGLAYRLDDSESGAIAYPIWNGAGADWQERAQSSYGENALAARLRSFQTVVAPELANAMQETMLYLGHSNSTSETASERRRRANEIIEHLSSGETSQIVQGLKKLSDGVSTDATHCTSTPSNQHCTGLMNCSLDINSSYRDCYFHIVQKDFLDSEIWQSDESGYTFKPNNYGAYFRIRPTLTSYEFQPHHGVKPMTMGQRFFIDYHQKFENNQIDTGYFPNDYVSLTDYLSYNLICGPRDFSDNWDIFGRLSSPDFSPIRPGYNINIYSYCNTTNYVLSGPEPGDEWRTTSGFYDDIRRNGEHRFNTLSALLYNYLSDEFVNDFDGWWARKVMPQFQENFEFLYQENFVEALVEGELGDILYGSSYESTCANADSFCGEYNERNRNSLKSTVLQEMDLYFSNAFDPMVRTFPLDLRYTSFENERAARNQLSSDYNRLRSEIYTIVKSIYSTVNVNHFDGELLRVYNMYSEEVQAHKEAAQVEEATDRFKLDVLKFVLAHRMYDLRIMFKSDLVEHIRDYRAAAANVINDLDLSESERAHMLSELDSEVNQMINDKNSRAHRNNRVIVEYHDWPEDLNLSSPTLEGVSAPSLDRIHALVDYFISMNQMRDLLVTQSGN